MTIEELRARLADLQESAKAIQAKADAEKRDLTSEEESQLETIFADFEKTEADIKRRERLSAQESKLAAPVGRKVAPEQPRNESALTVSGNARISGVSHPAERARWGWQAFGDFAAAVKAAAVGANVDQRLQNASLTTYGSEGVGADGGFVVPPEFRSTIMQKVFGEASILSRCDQVETSGYSATFPKDETTPWGATGVQAYWDGEASTMTQRKPALETSTIRLHKLTALVPVTDELLEDAPAMGSYVQRKAADVIDFRVTDAILNGTGAGMPQGIVGANCTVSVSKESSQVAATIHGKNLVKMWARMPAAWRPSAVWLVHPDAETELMQAGLQVGPAAAGTATGGQLVYMPPGGISGAPYASLFGRPIIPTEACQALGTAGDIVFAALGQYAALIKAGGLKSDSSIHLWFDQGVTAFRFTFRMGGQPWWSSAISPKNGSTTRGPFVKLETRG